MQESPSVTLARLRGKDLSDNLQELGELLHACVHDGANINFILPFSVGDAIAFWNDKVMPALDEEHRFLFVAWEHPPEGAARLAGAVQLNCDMPPNQAHRAEITKLLVHPTCRRRGIARKLMREAENQARRLERSLITLDTTTGSAAEQLYLSLGYLSLGAIPAYARDPKEDRLDPATILYKQL
ncbi:MAG: GNAT family N-acetyltransferase [Pseudomonadota bacterium]|uniref:GNAT family N-acetyltransferase n=1 Tax=Fodinicurvata fenggangensis TaxID=1121830 RepID=UPI0006900D78|nr:GNAT family N-acetyltransferase [Fodinicurvata fenggangensis]